MRRTYISLIAGAALAVVAIALIWVYVASVTRGSHAPDGDFTRIAVAAVDMPSGTVLTAPDIVFVRWPKSSVPAGAFEDIDAIFKGAKSAQDRVTLTSIARGEPLLRTKVSGLGARPIMSTMVDESMRAVSIKIDDVSGVSGFILPGDHVDIILTRKVGDARQSLETDILLQNIRVLGIDQLANPDANKPVVGRTATVEVTPEQAGKLVLAQQAGTLSLTLRNPSTVDDATVARLVESDLAGRRPAPRVRRVSEDTVQVHYGVADAAGAKSASR